MQYNLHLVYEQYIQPMTFNEQIALVQRILQNFKQVQKSDSALEIQDDILSEFRKFKGIAKSEEDWYKQ